MNLGQIKTLGRIYLNDPNSVLWTDAELEDYVQETIEELVIHSQANMRKYELPLVSGTRSYSLPTDIYEVRGVRINKKKAYGTSDQELEELDTRYLTATGTPEWYYLEDVQTIAFYPVPSWTATYADTFDQETGVLVAYDDGDEEYTFNQDTGVIYDAIDSNTNKKFLFDYRTGVMIAAETEGFVAEITYINRPAAMTSDNDSPSLPEYMHYAVLYGMVAEALGKDGQGQNKQLQQFFTTRYEELQTEFRHLHVEEERGQDQFPSQQTLDWGSDLDWRFRVWP